MNDVAVTDLTRLADVARNEHAAVGGSFKNAVEHAIRCGETLQAAKAKIDPGSWLTWLSGTGIKERTAQRYMQIAANREKLEDAVAKRSATVAGPTLNGAMALIFERKAGTRRPQSNAAQGLLDQLIDVLERMVPRERVAMAENVVLALRDKGWIGR
jgi:hypothetical protein